jgi:integrase
MKGCIFKRGKKYSVVIELGRDNNGKRIQKWFSGYKTKKEAEKALVTILHQIETNTFINPEKITLAEYLRQWMHDYVEPNLAPKTIDGYKVNIEGHIIPSIGNIPLQKLQPIHIQQFYRSKLENGRLDDKGGLSAKSVLYIHRVLRKALSNALKMQLIPRNVADAVELPKAKTYYAKFLNEKELRKLLNTLKNTDIYIPVLLASCLGLRRGEALGLQWKDIDFENKTISVIRALLPSIGGTPIFHEAKTKTSERTIVISDSIIFELEKHRNKQQRYRKLLGNAYKDYDLVTCLNNGSPINPASFSHTFARTLKKHNLRHIRFHDLRHSNATLMLKHNISPKVASERLGHSKINITLDLYSHVLKEMQEEAANKIDNAIFNFDKEND